MSKTKVAEVRPVGFELFQDSETFLDQLCDDWELDSVNSATTGLVISHAIGLYPVPIGIPTQQDFLLNAAILKENIPSLIP